MKIFKEYVESINGGLIKTYDIDETIFYIDNQMNRINLDHNIIKNPNNTFDIELLEFNKIDSSIYEHSMKYILGTLIDLFGWFPGSMTMINIYGMKNIKKFDYDELSTISKNLTSVTIRFESKFDLKINNIKDKLYHLTIKEYKNKINRFGLIPKKKSKLSSHDYDNRIYVCDDLEACKKLIHSMRFFYETEKINILKDFKQKKNVQYIIYEIDTKCADIKKLYQDPNYIHGYYVLDNISKDCIKVIEEE